MSALLRWADHRVVPSRTETGPAVLFGTDHASLFALEPPVDAVLARWRSRSLFALDDAPRADRDALAALCAARVLVPIEQRGPGCAAPEPAAVPLTTLVLEIAQACNMRCAYCYADGGGYGGDARLMPAELARQAVRYLVAQSGAATNLTLVLFGGEPLLNLPALRAAVLAAEDAAAATNKGIAISLTTNGTRFTPEVVEFLVQHRVGVTVSIDGPPPIHDANRRYAGSGGTGTYGDVMAGLCRFREGGGRPAARVTLTPAQWPSIPEVFSHLATLDLLEIGIAPASPVSFDLLPTRAEEEALLASFAVLADQFVASAATGTLLPFSNLLDLLGRLHAGNVKSAPCGAGLGYLAVDAGGRLFLCHRLAGVEGFRVGDLDGGVDHARIATCLAAQAEPRRADCARCWARTLCAGGCHHDNYVREHDLGLPPGGSCEFIRRWIELGIGVYAELHRLRADAVLDRLQRRCAH